MKIRVPGTGPPAPRRGLARPVALAGAVFVAGAVLVTRTAFVAGAALVAGVHVVVIFIFLFVFLFILVLVLVLVAARRRRRQVAGDQEAEPFARHLPLGRRVADEEHGDRLVDELDPAEFGAADDVNQALAELAADLRADGLTVHRLHGVCTHVELLYEALREVSELHGWGWEIDTDAYTTQQPALDTEPGVEAPAGLGDPTPPETDE